ncbi:hypothetical protein HOLleu_11185 [Holothuria leucospilota]|uniref:DUF7869 domain-containing protein n=1 Tax=Holothuria leucospilota TaxID=206669 RepID=A0A9Q1CEJ7_HOLLE|nr:hypothetical protein HOLleu_11185 [Holothuria leucospilota]
MYVLFLPVGHIHEDVDQMFSCVEQHLRHTNVCTLEDLAKEAAKSFTPNTDVRPVITVQDVKALFSQHLYSQFANHSRPLWFRFRKVDKRCYMHFKKWECEMWEPESCEEYPHGYLVLKDVPELHQRVEWVMSNLERLDVEKLTKELPEAYRHRLPSAAQHWWAKFISNLSSTYEVLSSFWCSSHVY